MHRAAVALAAFAEIGCEPSLALRGSQPVAAEISHASGATLDLPAIGDAAGATLADGWPVWVVRHADASITIIDAVAPRARSGATLFAGDGALVRWAPSRRRLIAGDVAYDELGRALGYADAADPEPPDAAADLATYAFTVDGDRLAIGERRSGPPPPERTRWVDYDRAPHVARELAPGDRERVVAPAIAITDAATAPIGSYHLVRGELVLSIDASPRVCECGGCVGGEPTALGLSAVTISARVDHLEPALMLVRRDPDGLAIIATSRAGACGS